MYGTQSLSGFIQAAEVLTGRTVIPKNVFIMHCYLLGGTLLRALKTLNVMTTQEVDTVKITSHRNKKILALQCFLIVKSFLSVVSQFALAGNTCGLKCPQQGREGTAGPCAGTGHGPGAGAQRGELTVQGVREPQAALICAPGWDRAGTGGNSLFPDNFLLSCHPPDQQDRQPRLRFLLDSLLEWKKLVCVIWTFQNVLFHFKGLSVRRNCYGQLHNFHTESTP